MRNLKKVTLPQQRRHHRILRMRMNTTPRVPLIERVPKQRRTRRFLEVLFRTTEKDAIGVWRRGGGLWEGQDEHVRGFDTFFLNARRCDVDFVPGYMDRLEIDGELEETRAHPTRIQIPPPVPVTQPSL